MRNCKIPPFTRVLKVPGEKIHGSSGFNFMYVSFYYETYSGYSWPKRTCNFGLILLSFLVNHVHTNQALSQVIKNFGLLGQHTCWPVRQNVFLKVPFCKAIIHWLEETCPKSSKLRLAKNIYYICISSLFRHTGIIKWKPIILHMELWK